MSEAYRQLLDATILHLQELKARGRRFVAVSPEVLTALGHNVKPKSRAGTVSQNSQRHDRPAPGPAPVRTASAGQSAYKPADLAVSAGPAPIRHATAGSGVPVQPVTPARSDSEGVRKRPQSAAEEAVELGLSLPGQAPAAIAAPVLGLEAKAAAFADLRQRAVVCVKCSHLAASRKNVVFGVGDIAARLMFVGEAPGADEDEQGEPFVGKAGELLTKIIQAMGLTRNTVYIANILKCRPDTPGQSAGNRKPTPDEMKTCIPFLHEQIDLIQPQVLVALGATAVEGLLGKTVGITRLRGTWKTYRGIPLMPTYHPAYLLRNQAPAEKRRLWEDMLQVLEKLGLPISERQRNFFLKG